MEGNKRSYQLIDEHKTYNKSALETVIASLGNCSKDYFTVAIIGAQNTGKSTLLNELFKTDFSVLKGEAGKRTTRGVVLSRDYQDSLIIMDVEGNDSYETHLEGDSNYEKMVSSFALIGANILLVNIYEKQLGQHSGSQYETLSTVMRICIDQFKQQSPKTILFCLRDANPEYTDVGECRRKVQLDVLNIWKSVFTGTKRSVEFEKYVASPERFFSLQVSFLREYDVDYPEDFKEDVAKLRERFINPSDEGYLFKKQKKEYNLPIDDMVSLLDKVWHKLVTTQELNLPNEKVQVANYRCQEYCHELVDAFEKQLEANRYVVRNYTTIFNELRHSFQEKSKYYSKQITEKWLNVLIEKASPKIRKIANELIQIKDKDLEEQFKTDLDNLFFDLEHTTDNFKVQAEGVKVRIVNELVNVYKQINYEISERKEKIDHFETKLEKIIEEDVKRRLEQEQKEFQNETTREMGLLVATVLKNNFNLSFYTQITRLYFIKKEQLLKNYNKKLIWARGSGGTANELDDAEFQMVEALKSQTKRALQNNILQKLFEYFKENFYFDQHQIKYDYNSLNDQKAIQIFSQAKQMALNLIRTLNNFRIEPERRSSMILTDDIEDENDFKPLLQSNTVLSIQQHFERKAADEYAAVVRKRNETHMKQVPTYLFALIFYFIYDDIWISYEDYPILHSLLIGLIACIGLVYAVGQGPIMRQIFEIFYEKLITLLIAGRDKVSKLREVPSEKIDSEKKTS